MNRIKPYFTLKSTFISILLFVCVFLLANLSINFGIKEDLFAVSLSYAAKVIVLLFATEVLILLSVGYWHGRMQYLIVPLPVSLALFAITLYYSPAVAPIIFIASLIALLLYVHSATKLQDLLIKYEPILILRPLVKGLMFVISIYAAISVILNSVSIEPMDITNMALDNLVKTAPSLLDSQLIKTLLRAQISGVLNSYKQFLQPLAAVLTFIIFQLYGWVAYMLFVPLAPLLNKIALKSGFYKKETIQVDKEIIKF